MSTLDHRVWTCDRCKSEVILKPGQQPTGWLGLEFTSPPLAGFTHGRRHLCSPCEEAFGEFLFPRASI